MNFAEEKKKVQRMNRAELSRYEEQLKKLQAEARKNAAKAEAERRESFSQNKSLCVPEVPERSLVKTVLALSRENRLKDLNKAVQIRKNQLLTPAEKIAKEKRIKAIQESIDKALAA